MDKDQLRKWNPLIFDRCDSVEDIIRVILSTGAIWPLIWEESTTGQIKSLSHTLNTTQRRGVSYRPEFEFLTM